MSYCYAGLDLTEEGALIERIIIDGTNKLKEHPFFPFLLSKITNVVTVFSHILNESESIDTLQKTMNNPHILTSSLFSAQFMNTINKSIIIPINPLKKAILSDFGKEYVNSLLLHFATGS